MQAHDFAAMNAFAVGNRREAIIPYHFSFRVKQLFVFLRWLNRMNVVKRMGAVLTPLCRFDYYRSFYVFHGVSFLGGGLMSAYLTGLGCIVQAVSEHNLG